MSELETNGGMETDNLIAEGDYVFVTVMAPVDASDREVRMNMDNLPKRAVRT